MTQDHRKIAQPAYRLTGDTFEPLPPATSGWDPSLVNGSASSGLAAALLERQVGGAGFAPARLTIDLLRPVPYAPLAARAVTVREGRRLRLAEVELLHEGRPVVRASGLFLASEGAATFRGTATPPAPPEELASGKLLPDFDRPMARPPFQHYCDVRWASELDALNPTVWIRPPEFIVQGMPASALARAAAIADLLAGVIATHQTRVDGGYFSAINADVQLTFAGPPRGDWFALRLDRLESLGGSGFASADLFDRDGLRGRVTHSRVSNERQPAVMASVE